MGMCIDQLATGPATRTAVPNVVDCSDRKATAKILKVYDSRTAADADELCGNVPGSSSFVELDLTNSSTKLLCLARN